MLKSTIFFCKSRQGSTTEITCTFNGQVCLHMNKNYLNKALIFNIFNDDDLQGVNCNIYDMSTDLRNKYSWLGTGPIRSMLKVAKVRKIIKITK